MKFLLVLAVAAYAKAEAEADPGFVYTVGSVPVAPVAYHAAPALTYAAAPALTYAAAPALTYAVPHVYTVPAAGCQNNEGAFVPCAQGSYFGLVPVAAAAPAAAAEAAPAVVSVEKREAEGAAEAEASADPEADPWLYYSGLYGGYGRGLGYSHYSPLTYSYAPHTYSHVYNHYGLGHYGLGYSGYSGLGYSGYYGRKKREAEAEPEAVADPEADPWLVYGGFGGYGARHHGYGYAYAPYTYAAYHHPLTYFYGGCRNNQGAVVPCAGR